MPLQIRFVQSCHESQVLSVCAGAEALVQSCAVHMQGAGRGWAAAYQLHRGRPWRLPLLCQHANHHPQKAAAGTLPA